MQQDLFLHFEKLLTESPNFRYLKQEEQEEIRNIYRQATAETLSSAIELLEQDTAATNLEIGKLNQELEISNITLKQLQLKEKLLEIKKREDQESIVEKNKAEDLLAELKEI